MTAKHNPEDCQKGKTQTLLSLLRYDSSEGVLKYASSPLSQSERTG